MNEDISINGYGFLFSQVFIIGILLISIVALVIYLRKGKGKKLPLIVLACLMVVGSGYSIEVYSQARFIKAVNDLWVVFDEISLGEGKGLGRKEIGKDFPDIKYWNPGNQGRPSPKPILSISDKRYDAIDPDNSVTNEWLMEYEYSFYTVGTIPWFGDAKGPSKWSLKKAGYGLGIVEVNEREQIAAVYLIDVNGEVKKAKHWKKGS